MSTEQQYFDVEKRLTESQEQIIAHTRDVQVLKEQNRILSKSSSLLAVTVVLLLACRRYYLASTYVYFIQTFQLGIR